jgi:CheY-like chemotaxis protein
MKKILITDDDPGMMDAFSIIFKRAGYDTTVISSATPILENKCELPDLFILDKQLSGVDGIDVCRFLKNDEHTKHIPVIIISATPHVATLAAQAGADAFVEKPFRNKELLAIVARCLEQQQ